MINQELDELKETIRQLEIELENKKALQIESTEKRLKVWQNNLKIDDLIVKYLDEGNEKSFEQTSALLKEIKALLPFNQAQYENIKRIAEMERNLAQLTVDVGHKESIISQHKLMNKFINDKLTEENTSLKEKIIELKETFVRLNEETKANEEENRKLEERCEKLANEAAQLEDDIFNLKMKIECNENRINDTEKLKRLPYKQLGTAWDELKQSILSKEI